MDVLTSRQLRLYDKLSRYQEVPFNYHLLDNKYIVEIGKLLSANTAYSDYTTKSGDTFDSIALEKYGTPTYYWVIMDFNRFNDPFIKLPAGIRLRVPTLSNIEFL